MATAVWASSRVTALSVDVVICAYTRQRWELLCRAVESVQAQVVSPAKIILCIDHNDELAARCLETWPPTGQPVQPAVQVLRNRFDGRLGSARNTAVEQVSADVIAFLDDDAEADPTWLQSLLKAYRETGAVAVGGAPLPRFETQRPGWFPQEFDWVFGCHYVGLPEDRRPVRHLIGASMSVRSDALRRVGGFHSDNHDDMDMSHRIAAAFGRSSVVYEPQAKVYHFVTAERVTWRYFWRRCYYVNRGKVHVFADMGHAGNLDAELAFARQMLKSTLRRLLDGLSGDTSALAQAAVLVAGLGLAGLGHVRGKAELRLGHTPDSATQGLDT